MRIKRLVAVAMVVLAIVTSSCTEVKTLSDAGQTAARIVPVMQMVGDATCGAGK